MTIRKAFDLTDRALNNSIHLFEKIVIYSKIIKKSEHEDQCFDTD